MPHSPWSLILAAGHGRRLASVTGGLPKQFWAPHGERTLLEHTVDRMTDLSPLTRIVTVVDRSQRAYAEAINSRTPVGRLTYQAGDRGTAAGVLRGLVEVTADPDALVVLTPADHGVAEPGVFREGIREAARHIQRTPAGIVHSSRSGPTHPLATSAGSCLKRARYLRIGWDSSAASWRSRTPLSPVICLPLVRCGTPW